MPVRAGYVIRLSDSFDIKFSAGPYLGLGLFGKSKWTVISGTDSYYPVDSDGLERDLFGENGIMHRFEVGVSGKAVLRFKGHYGISVEYARQFNPMYKSHYSKMYNQTLSFGLSYTM